jgi:alpha-L-fucosidase
MRHSGKIAAALAVLGLAFALIAAAAARPQAGSSSGQGRNFALILPGDSPSDIVRKAANVVPSGPQWAWQERELIAFAHFGMNTFTNREWGQGTEDPKLFNPSDFDARQWAKALKDAGMGMLILTAKHHDGFCLWPSRYTHHSVKSSPWRGGKGDVVGDVVKACREFGLKAGIYLSPWDRHEPSFGDSPKYNEHFRNQLRELLTNYGPIDEVWFDGANGEGPNGKKQVYDWPSFYKVIRDLQPQAVIFGMAPDLRWVGTESGYGRETEWSVVPIDLRGLDPAAAAKAPNPLDAMFTPGDMTAADLGSREKIAKAPGLFWYPAETDVSIRPGWFYHPAEDGKVKTPEKLLDIYYSSVGRNSTLLLNVPPDTRGRIHDNDIKSLLGMKAILDATFRTNLAAAAAIKATSEERGHGPAPVLDGNTDSYWTPAEGIETAALEMECPAGRTFDRAMLQEYIRAGQRIEGFVLEAWDGSAWKAFARGTTVGYKRLLRFEPVTARKIRLTIEQSRTCPTIAEFGLYRAPSK